VLRSPEDFIDLVRDGTFDAGAVDLHHAGGEVISEPGGQEGVEPVGQPEKDAGRKIISGAVGVDGMHGEGAAVERARLAAPRAGSLRIRQILDRIAVDEHRHASLARRIATWTVERGGDDVRDAVADLRQLDDAGVVGEPTPVGPAVYGCGDANDGRRARERTATQVNGELEALLRTTQS